MKLDVKMMLAELELLAVRYDLQSQEPGQLALRMMIAAKWHALESEIGGDWGEKKGIVQVDNALIVSLNKQICQLEEAQLCPKKKQRPTLSSVDHSMSSKSSHPLVTDIPKSQLDPEEGTVSRYLQMELRNQMYVDIGYHIEGTMPNKGKSPVEELGTYMEPDFKGGINANANIKIRDVWWTLSTNKKWVKTAECPSSSKAAKLRQALRDFADNNHLEYEAIKDDLAHEDWLGDECSCDEDGTKNAGWQQLLFEMGKITQEEHDNPDLQVLKVKCPVWKSKNFWEWEKGLLTQYSRKRLHKGNHKLQEKK
ncbi:hypothetical protein DACRYDRAFT_18866 [Dacryopinax primogenitus]|uniref:Uncharacterized protein n=1 Tax=Dacryopinax primogenitus (strain DJM 731) TaxID=1858805 RepID=M5FV12_DACPD|nr:uncharacterized protein DACRYDRAFT_18866 [Dacryopinax primogenitus]EJT97131.1 hypothetical protein DACRYDRAFT_18866 [Dacryopinax primogenitus]